MYITCSDEFTTCDCIVCLLHVNVLVLAKYMLPPTVLIVVALYIILHGMLTEVKI